MTTSRKLLNLFADEKSLTCSLIYQNIIIALSQQRMCRRTSETTEGVLRLFFLFSIQNIVKRINVNSRLESFVFVPEE